MGAPLYVHLNGLNVSNDIPHSIIQLQRGTPASEAIDKDNNQPHIVHFKNEDDEDGLMQQYFICVEQQLMMESSNLVSALFLCLAAHYIFNIQYHPKAKDVWEFIQENIANVSSKGTKRRNVTSCTHFSGILRMHSTEVEQ